MAVAGLGVMAWLVLTSIFGTEFRPVPAWPAEPISGERPRSISFARGCGDTMRLATLEETATEVRVELEGKGIAENDCEEFFVVELAEELGERAVVDLVTGRRFRPDLSVQRGWRVVED